MNPHSGVETWRTSVGGSVKSTVAIGGQGSLYVASNAQNLIAVNSASGEIEWTFSLPDYGTYETFSYVSRTSSPIVGTDETVFISTDAGEVYALDGNSGAVRWSRTGFGPILSTPALTMDGTLYIGSLTSGLFALNALNGDTRWRNEGGAVEGINISPNGSVFVERVRNVEVLAGSSPMALTPWPCERGNPGLNGTSPVIHNGPPVILIPPKGRALLVGHPLELSVLATGTLPLSYQWTKNGQPIPGSKNELLRSGVSNSSIEGLYTVIVSNILGTVSSLPIRVVLGHRVEADTLGPGKVEVVYSGTEPKAIVYAHPQPGRDFVGWRGDASGRDNPLELRLSTNWHVVAEFEIKPGEIRWRRDIGKAGMASPAISKDGQVVIANSSSKLFSFTRNNGTLNWTHQVAPPRAEEPSSPIIDHLGHLILGVDGTYFSFDSDSGHKLWNYQVSELGSFVPSPAVSSNGLLLGGSYERLFGYSLSPKGAINWNVRITGVSKGSPTLSPDGLAILGTENGSFVAIDIKRQTVAWTRTTKGPNSTSPALGSKGLAYLSSEDGSVYAVNARTGDIIWTYATDGPLQSSVILDSKNRAFVGSDDTYLHCFDATTGLRRWTFKTQGPIKSTPLVSSLGVVYVGSDDGFLHAVATESGRALWSVHLGGFVRSSPTLGEDGVLYIAGGNSLVAIQAGGKLDEGPWPKYKANLENQGTLHPNFLQIPSIIIQPPNVHLEEGKPGEISVQVSAYGSLNYQWYRNGELFKTTDSPALRFEPFERKHEGNYRVSISNSAGTIQSELFEVNVGYHLDLQVQGIGRVIATPNRSSYPPGTEISLRAQTELPHSFVGWLGSVTNANYELTFKMDRSLTLQAVFETPPREKLWEYIPVGEVTATPALTRKGDRLFLGTTAGRVVALDAENGNQLWETITHGGPIQTPPTLITNESQVIVLGGVNKHNGSQVLGLNALTGIQRPVEAPWSGTSVLVPLALRPSGGMYVGSSSGYNASLTRLSTISGGVWGYTTTASFTTAPAVASDGNPIFGDSQGYLRKVLGPTRIQWEYASGAGFSFSPSVAGSNLVWVADNAGNVHCLNQNSGILIWSHATKMPSIDEIVEGPDGSIFHASTRGLMSLDGLSGKVHWTRTDLNCRTAPVALEDGTLLVVDATGSLLNLEGALGRELWRFRDPGLKILSAPTVSSDGAIFLVLGSKVVAVQGQSGLAKSRWPKPRGDLANSGNSNFEVSSPPTILIHPQDQESAARHSATFAIMASGAPALRYQWHGPFGPLVNSQSRVLQITNVTNADAGDYWVEVSNELGTTTSHRAKLSVGYSISTRSIGSGTVELSPNLSIYRPGDPVTITAIPDPLRQFLGWTGDARGAALQVRIIMDGPKDVAALFETFDGEPKWSRTLSTGESISRPTLDLVGNIYVIVGTGSLQKLERRTGEVIWRFQPSGSFGTSAFPVVDGERVLVTTLDGQLYCIITTTGQVLWRYPLGPHNNGTSIAIDSSGTLYCLGGDNGGITAIDTLNGSIKWKSRLPIHGAGIAPVLHPNGPLFVSGIGINPQIFALDLQNGKPKWHRAVTDLRPLTLGADGSVFHFENLHLVGLNWSQGRPKWNRPVSSDGLTTAMVVFKDGTLIATERENSGESGTDTTLCFIHPKTGDIVHRQSLGDIGAISEMLLGANDIVHFERERRVSMETT